jgi:dGTPase
VREDILAEGYGTPATLEGQIVKLSDAVAYINHDIADAIRAGLLSEEELPKEVTAMLGGSHSQRINALVSDIVERSWAATGEAPAGGGHEPEEVRIGMSPGVLAAANVLREFMFQRVYLWEGRREEAERAQQAVRALFGHYVEHPQDVQSDFVIASDPPWRRAADYVAGMTDGFALAAAERLGRESALGAGGPEGRQPGGH